MRTKIARCRHCGRRDPTRPRGLCFSCYTTPAVRDLYRVSERCEHGQPADFQGSAPEPMPTEHLPGSPEKVTELERRAMAGESLWSRKDGTRDE